MKQRKEVFGKGISMDELARKFSKRAPGCVFFLTGGSCIDTWPPVPTGGKN